MKAPLTMTVFLLLIHSAASAHSYKPADAFHELQRLERSILVHSARTGRIPESNERLIQIDAIHLHALVDPWGEDYVYRHPSTDQSRPFDLYSTGLNRVDDLGAGDDIVAWERRSHYQASIDESPGMLLALVLLFDGPMALLLFLVIHTYRRRQGSRTRATPAM